MDGARAVSDALDPGRTDPETLPEEEKSRAEIYGLLGRLLAAPADAAVLGALAQLDGDDSELGSAFRDLAQVAATIAPGAVAREYQDLFIGVGRGELLPYASFYLTGFLHERPLAELRGALAALGVERASGVKEPEDHVAALCEVMAGLITGAFGAPRSLVEQQKFFDAFLLPWTGRFFADLERANSARFYAAVGRVGRRFFEIEQTAFTIA